MVSRESQLIIALWIVTSFSGLLNSVQNPYWEARQGKGVSWKQSLQARPKGSWCQTWCQKGAVSVPTHQQQGGWLWVCPLFLHCKQ